MWDFESVEYREASKVRMSKHYTVDENGCWVWTSMSTKTKRGGPYSRFNYKNYSDYGHRVSYQLYVGPIPDGLVIDHLCRNTMCVNPDHLEAVTYLVNAQRAPKHVIHGDEARHWSR